ncbi:fimbrial biogenesis outer membrane usher protein [Pseudomonas sp. PDNC002]|nr:fimbrial biogenesis outer membrane usher protein [Pseudomonas sp. PDNC002]
MAGTSMVAIAGIAHAQTSGDLLAYSFDDNMLMGAPLGSGQLSRFNQPNQVDPGTYSVDLFVNGSFIARRAVEFRRYGEGNQAQTVPCLSDRFLADAMRVLPSKLNVSAKSGQDLSDTARCEPLALRLPGASAKFDIALLRMDVAVPQAFMDNKPRGYVDPSEWDVGSTMSFLNYDTSYYHSKYTGGDSSDSNYGYVGVNGGTNIGLWRLRHQGNYRYSDYGGQSQREYNSIRTYAQRALPGIRSEMTVGDTYTAGDLFNSMGFRGVQLGSDDRMLPDSMRSYAPQIRGVASTNARVVVSQNGHDIYETTVAPGPFIIDDLGGTNYQGDLDVKVVEADGRVSSFTVPFAAVPSSMRPGQSRYNVSVGQARYYGNGDDYFADATYQRGISNSLTVNTGSRIAQDYLAVLGGGVVASELGAFGFNTTFSTAKAENNQRKSGWRAEATYSRTFTPTATTLTLAGYRYSTDGFRDLSDVLGVREAEHNGTVWNSSTYQQRNQFVTTVSQSLGSYGSLYLSGSTADFYDGSSRNTQLQFGYSGGWRDLSYNLSYTRQKSVRLNNSDYTETLPEYITHIKQSNSYDDSIVMLSLSLPLGSKSSTFVSASASHRSGSSGGDSYQTGLSGTLGQDRTLSYSVNASRDSDYRTTDWGGSLQKQLPSATVGANYSQGDGYKQVSGSARGALVAHSGGLTFGPYLGDTFGLVEAKGAEGATIRGGQGARINSSGYAIVPSLNPYHYNQVSLNPQGINSKTELVETDRQVAPYAGAMVKLEFKTLSGQALLIVAKRADGSALPLGAGVFGNGGASLGMVGQGGQLYARAEAAKGEFTVKWGDASDEQCKLPYDMTGQNTEGQVLVRLNGTCG